MRRPFASIAIGVVVLFVGGCYRPNARDCQVRCGEGNVCPGNAVCSQGLCTAGPACDPPAAPLTCHSDCTAVAPSVVRCRGHSLARCDVNGWVQEGVCDGETPVCVDGSCAACVPGSTRCADGCLQTCPAASWQTITPCSACEPRARDRVLATGWSHACVILATGVTCWGGNDHGQLGLGHSNNLGDDENLRDVPADRRRVDLGSTPVSALAAGGRHTCALLDDGRVKCWGDNGNGQLGLGDTNHRGDDPGEMGDALPAVDLGTGRRALSIAAGGTHTCAVLDDGSVKCWGGNTRAQLGLGDSKARGGEACDMGDALMPLELGGRARALAAGTYHTCALMEDGTISCWGANGAGQLGTGNTTAYSRPRPLGLTARALSIVAGHSFTCAAFEDGGFRCWGSNVSGQLGQGTIEDQKDATRAVNVPFGAGTMIKTVVVGYSHLCALDAAGWVRCWGLANFGQLGRGNIENQGDDEPIAALATVALGTTASAAPLPAAALTAGGDHTCALLDGGLVKCWGENAFGQLGVGDRQHRGDDPDEMGDALPFVSLPGPVAGF